MCEGNVIFFFSMSIFSELTLSLSRIITGNYTLSVIPVDDDHLINVIRSSQIHPPPGRLIMLWSSEGWRIWKDCMFDYILQPLRIEWSGIEYFCGKELITWLFLTRLSKGISGKHSDSSEWLTTVKHTWMSTTHTVHFTVGVSVYGFHRCAITIERPALVGPLK